MSCFELLPGNRIDYEQSEGSHFAIVAESCKFIGDFSDHGPAITQKHVNFDCCFGVLIIVVRKTIVALVNVGSAIWTSRGRAFTAEMTDLTAERLYLLRLAAVGTEHALQFTIAL
jgi:hypothetical protein